MKDFVKAHYGKLVAFVSGWIAEAVTGLSGYLEQLRAIVGF